MWHIGHMKDFNLTLTTLPFIIIYVAVAAHWVAYVYLSSHEGRHLSLSMKLSSTKENGWKAVGIFLGKVGFD